MSTKYIDLEEFQALGFVQEINRLVLHPAGLALEVRVDEDGRRTLGGVWDYRDDPEGVYYHESVLDADAVRKAATVRELAAAKCHAREDLLGDCIQPLPGHVPDDPPDEPLVIPDGWTYCPTCGVADDARGTIASGTEIGALTAMLWTHEERFGTDETARRVKRLLDRLLKTSISAREYDGK
jgi:hypothetical protein